MKGQWDAISQIIIRLGSEKMPSEVDLATPLYARQLCGASIKREVQC